MAKSNFLKKKELVPSLVNAGIRGASAYGSQAFLAPMVGNMLPAGIKPYKGLLIASVGVLGEVMLKDPKLKAVAQGVSTQGIMDVAGSLLGKTVQGLGKAEPEFIPGNENNAIDWEKLAQEVQEEFPGIKGNPEENAGDAAIAEAEDIAVKLS